MTDETKEIEFPEDIVRQIASEEKLRSRIRSELEKEKQQPESKAWKFLNSALGLFVLSSVLIAGLGGLFARLQQRVRERELQNQRILKLLNEFDYRMIATEFRTREFASKTNPLEKGALSGEIWGITVGEARFRASSPEFKDVHWMAIVSELKLFGVESLADEALVAIKEIESGQTLRAEPWGLYPDGFVEAKLATLHQYRKRIVLEGVPRFWKFLLGAFVLPKSPSFQRVITHSTPQSSPSQHCGH